MFLLKYSLQIQMSLLFQYLSLRPPCCCFCLFVCFEWSPPTYQWATWDGEQSSHWKPQCGGEMIPLVRDELQQVGAAIWPPPRANAEQRLKVNQGGEEGQRTQSHPPASYPSSTPHTNTPCPPPYCCACVSRRIRRQHGGGGANGVILLAPPPPCC